MGKLNNLGGNGEIFIGEDKTIEMEILDRSDVPVNITGWTITVVISLTPTSAALFTKTPATISGSYNAVRASNTQRASVGLTDTELATLTKGKYTWSAKRDENGSESILAWGSFVVQRANQV